MKPSIADIRREYSLRSLVRADVDPDPLRQFENWFAQAVESEVPDPTAMVLATATRDGLPAARFVLLKGVDAGGFVFFTNRESRKARELEENPRASLAFYWAELERQIRVEGRVERVSDEEADAYFRSRPRGSQIAAWVSRQSEVIGERAELENRARTLEERFGDTDVPRPPQWGGYRVIPDVIEFWQGRLNRLHDRLRYTLQSQGGWKIERLAP